MAFLTIKDFLGNMLCVTGVYAKHTKRDSRYLWEVMVDQSSLISLPWPVVGDFNVV